MSEFEQWFENSEWYGHLNINGARAVWQAAKKDSANTIAELQAQEVKLMRGILAALNLMSGHAVDYKKVKAALKAALNAAIKGGE